MKSGRDLLITKFFCETLSNRIEIFGKKKRTRLPRIFLCLGS